MESKRTILIVGILALIIIAAFVYVFLPPKQEFQGIDKTYSIKYSSLTAKKHVLITADEHKETISLSTDADALNSSIFTIIPKALAADINSVELLTNGEIAILESDPLIKTTTKNLPNAIDLQMNFTAAKRDIATINAVLPNSFLAELSPSQQEELNSLLLEYSDLNLSSDKANKLENEIGKNLEEAFSAELAGKENENPTAYLAEDADKRFEKVKGALKKSLSYGMKLANPEKETAAEVYLVAEPAAINAAKGEKAKIRILNNAKIERARLGVYNYGGRLIKEIAKNVDLETDTNEGHIFEWDGNDSSNKPAEGRFAVQLFDKSGRPFRSVAIITVTKTEEEKPELSRAKLLQDYPWPTEIEAVVTRYAPKAAVESSLVNPNEVLLGIGEGTKLNDFPLPNEGSITIDEMSQRYLKDKKIKIVVSDDERDHSEFGREPYKMKIDIDFTSYFETTPNPPAKIEKTIKVDYGMFAGGYAPDINLVIYLQGKNNPVDVNTEKNDGNSDNAAMPIFSHYGDGNITIDFNVSDTDVNGVNRLDANIDFQDTNGLSYRIVTDLNLMVKGICDDINFSNTTRCTWDWNIFYITDRNGFIDVNVTDNNGSTDSNSTDLNFGIRNREIISFDNNVMNIFNIENGVTEYAYVDINFTSRAEHSDANAVIFTILDNGGTDRNYNATKQDINTWRISFSFTTSGLYKVKQVTARNDFGHVSNMDYNMYFNIKPSGES